MVRLLALLAFLLAACSGGYGGLLSANVTNYSIRNTKGWPVSPKGVRVKNATPTQLLQVDKMIDEVEKCLGKSIHRDWLAIYIVQDSFISACTGRQQLPWPAHPRFCAAKSQFKDKIPIACLTATKRTSECPCFGLKRPTTECPCICNWGSAIQNGFWIIVTPSLRNLKQEIVRLVTRTTSISYVWNNDKLKKCVR